MRPIKSAAFLALALTASLAFAEDPKPAATSAPATAPEKLSEEGFTPIFNGKDLTDWDGDDIHWSVKDGAIHCEVTPETIQKGGNSFLTWKGGKPADFELRLTGRMIPGKLGGNSGIQFRSFTPKEKFFVGGYQMEINTDPKKCGSIYGELWRGGIANAAEKTVYSVDGKKTVTQIGDVTEIASHFNKNDWNDYRIVARGNHIELFLNGRQTVDLFDDYKGAFRSGVIALQLHQGFDMTLDFKDIRLKTFTKEGAAETKPAK